MNIFAFETKAQLKGFLVWAASLLALFLVLGVAFYGTFMASKSAVQDALDSLPPAFSAVFGVDINAVFSYGGFFQFIYTYLSLVGAIMASSIALSSFSREKRSKCIDFLFAKPASRGRIFLLKLLACLALIIVMNGLFVIVSMLAYVGNGQDPSQIGTLVLASLSLFFLQIVFMSIGILYAVSVRKVRSVSGTATAFGFAGFVLMALYSLIKEEVLRYISPLNYFNPGVVFSTGGFETRYAVTAAVVVIACIALAYVKYCKSDTQAI